MTRRPDAVCRPPYPAPRGPDRGGSVWFPAQVTPARRLAPAARRAAVGAALRVLPAPGHTQATIWEQSYPGTPAQVGCLRAGLRVRLASCPAGDDAVLVMSELAANAVRHSRSSDAGGRFTARLLTVPGRHVYGEMEDGGSDWDGNLRRSARDASGLDLVLTLSTTCGVAADGPARVVWFTMCCQAGWPG